MSGQGQLVVNFTALATAAGDINNAINTMSSQLDEAAQTAAPLVASWDGAARDAYQARQATWTKAANDLATMLRDIKRAVEQSAEQYQATEQRNTNLFS
ncbi:ESAT-6-like protein [Rhizocola hellebori]|uniref:ESAT-6-like protein n=1 Tax=Rhizocola hellebori TaxID=1392758 RepID=A0A8J3VMT6_9ACTN|nr:WXG100 family type VII secretion target [Rhizocola hellebori]GIH11443.1 ESAT-6-like protein [Rhizocola hellebori]